MTFHRAATRRSAGNAGRQRRCHHLRENCEEVNAHLRIPRKALLALRGLLCWSRWCCHHDWLWMFRNFATHGERLDRGRRNCSASFLDHVGRGLRWLCAHLEPMRHALHVEFKLFAFRTGWIEPTEFLNHRSVSRATLVSGAQSISWTMNSSETLET